MTRREGSLILPFGLVVTVFVLLSLLASVDSNNSTTKTKSSTLLPFTPPIAWNDTEQLAFHLAQLTNNSDSSVFLGELITKLILSSWNFTQVPNLFQQQSGVYPSDNSTQLPNFGALLPWPTILEMLSDNDEDTTTSSPPVLKKLFIFVRHGQSYENINPGPNSECTFVLGDAVIQNFDATLSPLGFSQTLQVNEVLHSVAPASQQKTAGGNATWFETMGLLGAPFFVSPATRTMQTALGVFGNFSIGDPNGPNPTPAVCSELLRPLIGSDVCNIRRPVHTLGFTAEQYNTSSSHGNYQQKVDKGDRDNYSDAPYFPPPFGNPCKYQENSSLAQSQSIGLIDLYGQDAVSNLTFEFPMRPPGGGPSLGLISIDDILWRSDQSEPIFTLVARSTAFLASVFSLISSPVVGVVTHSEMINAMNLATGGQGYPHNDFTEVVPMLIQLTP